MHQPSIRRLSQWCRSRYLLVSAEAAGDRAGFAVSVTDGIAVRPCLDLGFDTSFAQEVGQTLSYVKPQSICEKDAGAVLGFYRDRSLVIF